MTAQEVWDYDAGQSIYSSVCSSVYEAQGQSLLVDYATAAGDTQAILVGLNSQHETVFSFQYPAQGCDTSWNSQPIALDDLRIDQ
jgi:arylsulfate sulfotransferase